MNSERKEFHNDLSVSQKSETSVTQIMHKLIYYTLQTKGPVRQTDRQTIYFNTVSLQLQRIGFQESRAKKLLKTIQLQNFMIENY